MSGVNPFNHAFFELYKSVATGGNCHGMNVEQLWADKGRSRAGMPINDSYPETQDGRALTSVTAPLYREINIKQGDQLGLDALLYGPGGSSPARPTTLRRLQRERFFFSSDDRPTVRSTRVLVRQRALAHALRIPRTQACPNLDATMCARIYVADPNIPTRATRPRRPPRLQAPPRIASSRLRPTKPSAADNEYFYYAGEDVNGNPSFYRGGNCSAAGCCSSRTTPTWDAGHPVLRALCSRPRRSC